MAKPSAEQFAQRAFDLGLLDTQQLDAVWGEFRSRDISLDDFQNTALRKAFLTNYQCERLVRGERSGFFHGHYKVLYLVGSGTFARVYRACHRDTGDIVALKVLRTRFNEDAQVREQFVREGQVGSKLRHTNIVPIYEVHAETSTPFLVMEFIEGHNLREFVKIRKRLSPIEATRLIRDVVAGLAYAFKIGVTHRDLKMSNVLVSSRGVAKLVDFGLAAYSQRLTDEMLADYPNSRTIDYAGLERSTGVKKDDPRSDTYFAGTIFYHMLSGEPALFETKDRLARMSITRFQEIKPIGQLLPELPSAAAIVVNKAMELNPSRRYQTPGEMLDDLQSLLHRLENSNGEDGDTASISQDAVPAKSHRGGEGDSRTVLIVESNVEMQDIMRVQLKKHGYRVLVISDCNRAITRCQETSPPHCVVFCTEELGDAAVDAFRHLTDQLTTQAIPAILLAAGNHREMAKDIEQDELHKVISLPIKMKQFRSELKRIIDAGSTSS